MLGLYLIDFKMSLTFLFLAATNIQISKVQVSIENINTNHLNFFGHCYSLEIWGKNSVKANPNFLFVMVMGCNLKNVYIHVL